MKLSKILFGAVAAVAVMGLSSCGNNEDQHGILKISGDTASVDYTNETTDTTYRGFRTLKTKHTDAVAVVSIDTNQSTAVNDRAGVFGFVFDLDKTTNVKNSEEVKKTVYDFLSVSVRANGNAIQAYVSKFEGVDSSNMDGGNNFKDIDGNELSTTEKTIGGHTAKETELLKGNSSAYAVLTGFKTTPTDGIYKVAIEVIANTDGTYTIKFYDGTDAVAESAKDEDGVKTGQIKSGAKQLTITGTGTGKVDNAVIADASWKTDETTETEQTDMGFYAAVYPSCTLVGSIQLPYILNESEVVEWED